MPCWAAWPRKWWLPHPAPCCSSVRSETDDCILRTNDAREQRMTATKLDMDQPGNCQKGGRDQKRHCRPEAIRPRAARHGSPAVTRRVVAGRGPARSHQSSPGVGRAAAPSPAPDSLRADGGVSAGLPARRCGGHGQRSRLDPHDRPPGPAVRRRPFALRTSLRTSNHSTLPMPALTAMMRSFVWRTPNRKSSRRNGT